MGKSIKIWTYPTLKSNKNNNFPTIISLTLDMDLKKD